MPIALTHSTSPIPSGNRNVSGSLNGGVVNHSAILLLITGGCVQFSMVVQIERRSERVGRHPVGGWAPVAHADSDRKDAAEQMVGRVPSRDAAGVAS